MQTIRKPCRINFMDLYHFHLPEVLHTPFIKTIDDMSLQFQVRIFSYCTFHLFQNRSADLLLPSGSLADHLILTQSSPIILENLEETNLFNHGYLQAGENSSLYHFKFPFTRLSCHILLTALNDLSNESWINRKTLHIH